MKKITFIFLTALSLLAQRSETTLVFVHGLGAEASFWNEMPEALRVATSSGNQIHFTYGYNNDKSMKQKSLEELTDEFVTELNAQNNNENLKQHILFVAHSMGGLIVRNYIRRNEAFKDRVIGVISLSTPHQGAPGSATTLAETQNALTGHMTNITKANIYRRAGWFGSLLINAVASIVDVFIFLDDFTTDGDIGDKDYSETAIDNFIGDIINVQLAAQATTALIYRDLTPNSGILNTLNANKATNIPFYTMSADERFPLFWRFLGNTAEVRESPKKLFDQLLDKTVNNENDGKQSHYQRRREFSSRVSVWSWLNGTRSEFKKGRDSMSGINAAYSKLTKAYRVEWRSGLYWSPCDTYFDERYDDTEGDMRVSLFKPISERAPDCVDGYWTNYTYSVTNYFANDGLVPTWHAQRKPVDDPNSNEAKLNNHNNYHHSNHTQIGQKQGLWAKPSDTQTIHAFGITFAFEVEKYQDNESYKKMLDIVNDVYDAEFPDGN